MFNSNDGYSLADIAAATGNGRGGYGGDGFFGGSGWWIILLFLFAWGGWGNNGWGNGNGSGNAATLYGLDSLGATRGGFYDLDICNLGLQNCQNTNAITNAITSGTMAGMQNTFTLSSQLANMQAAQQLANCQTDQNISSAFAQLNYNLATEACADRAAVTTGARDIIDNANANTRAILDFLVQDRITALTTENQALKGQISQSEQNSYLISQLRPSPIPAYLTASPYYGYGFGYGMGGSFYGPSNIIA